MSKINDVMQLRADPTPEEWNDVVNKPPHYNQGGMEAIDYIKQQLGEGIVDYCEGNVLKYLHRWRYKNGLQDFCLVLKQDGQRTIGARMKVIEGNFGEKANEDKITVPLVFNAITEKEDLTTYEDAFCVVKSEEFIVVSTNMDTLDLYFLLDQLKLSLLTGGDYEL